MKRVLKKNQKFDWGRIINVTKDINTDDFIHDPNYCPIYIYKPYTVKEWKEKFKFTELNKESIESFLSECISFPKGYYWNSYGNSLYIDAREFAAGYFNKRTEELDPNRKINIYFGNDNPDISYPDYYPSFVKWARRVEKKIIELYKVMKKDNAVEK